MSVVNERRIWPILDDDICESRRWNNDAVSAAYDVVTEWYCPMAHCCQMNLVQ